MVVCCESEIFFIALGRRKKGIKSSKSLAGFLNELQKDYCQVKSKKKMIIKPFFWGLVLNLSDIAMFYCVFLALGHPINPAPLVAAYGLAGASSIFMVTPGGAGAYELIMVAFLAATGIDNLETKDYFIKAKVIDYERK